MRASGAGHSHLPAPPPLPVLSRRQRKEFERAGVLPAPIALPDAFGDGRSPSGGRHSAASAPTQRMPQPGSQPQPLPLPQPPALPASPYPVSASPAYPATSAGSPTPPARAIAGGAPPVAARTATVPAASVSAEPASARTVALREAIQPRTGPTVPGPVVPGLVVDAGPAASVADGAHAVADDEARQAAWQDIISKAPSGRDHHARSPRQHKHRVERALRIAERAAAQTDRIELTAAGSTKKRFSALWRLVATAAVFGLVMVNALPMLNMTSSASAEGALNLSHAADEQQAAAQVLPVEETEVLSVAKRDAISTQVYHPTWNGYNLSYTTNVLGAVQWPIPFTAPFSAVFGWRTSTNSYHNGIDLTPGLGAPIVSIADGEVTAVLNSSWGYGVHVEVWHPELGVMSRYAHMLKGSPLVQPGDKVVAGQRLGSVGNTGRSTGAHLHFEVHVNGHPVDPYIWLTEHATP